MKPVMMNIKKRLENDQYITLKQFNSIIKWIERDVRMKRDDLLSHFSPVILELQPPPPEPNTLEKFMIGEPIYECRNQS